MQFHEGANLLATDSTAPYAFTWTSVPAGSYSLTATATDDAGGTSTSAPVTVTVTGAPAVAQTYYIHADHLNSPRVITDANQVVVWRWDNSDPFGANVASEDPDGNGISVTCNLRFPGQYFDRETGNHYNFFRDYDPGTGRYIESDPIGLDGGLNTFGYVGSDPLRYVDSNGLLPHCSPPAFENPFGFQFGPCCLAHDNCYAGIGCDQSKSQKECDQAFRDCLKALCNRTESWSPRRNICLNKANTYYQAVRFFGGPAFRGARGADPGSDGISLPLMP